VLRFILLAILLLLVTRALWRLVGGIIEASGGHPATRGSAVKLVRDPVCGTYVAPRPSLSLTSGGSTHYFCSERCREQFQRS
jgi:YHS domain-containing protein